MGLYQMRVKLLAFSETRGHCAVMIFYEVLFLPSYACDGETTSSISESLCPLWLLSSKSFCESGKLGNFPVSLRGY